MSDLTLPPAKLETLENRLMAKGPIVIITYRKSGSLCSTLCSSKEEYESANVLLLFDDKVDPFSIEEYGSIPTSWTPQ